MTHIYLRPNQGLWVLDICGFYVFEKRAEPIIGRHKDKPKYSWNNTERLDLWKSRLQGGGRNESFRFFWMNLWRFPLLFLKWDTWVSWGHLVHRFSHTESLKMSRLHTWESSTARRCIVCVYNCSVPSVLIQSHTHTIHIALLLSQIAMLYPAKSESSVENELTLK